MTNNEIIFENVHATFTAEQLDDLVRAAYTTEQIDARRGETTPITLTARMAADTFHTFSEWKRKGYSVKKGQHASLVCNLWKYTDKPGKASKDSAAAAGQSAPENDPHFYMAKSHLFNFLQVEKSK